MRVKLLTILMAATFASAPVFADVYPLLQMDIGTRIIARPVAFINYIKAQRKLSRSFIYKFHIKKMGKTSIKSRNKVKSPFIKKVMNRPGKRKF